MIIFPEHIRKLSSQSSQVNWIPNKNKPQSKRVGIHTLFHLYWSTEHPTNKWIKRNELKFNKFLNMKHGPAAQFRITGRTRHKKGSHPLTVSTGLHQVHTNKNGRQSKWPGRVPSAAQAQRKLAAAASDQTKAVLLPWTTPSYETKPSTREEK